MSSFKSTNYNLHKWEGSDDVVREEFNQNTDTIDTELKNLDTRLTEVGTNITTQVDTKLTGLYAMHQLINQLTLNVRPTGTLLEGEFRTIGDAIDSLPRHLDGDTIIKVLGTGHVWTEGKITIAGFYGKGSLQIYFGDHTNIVSTYIHSYRNAVDTFLYDGHIKFLAGSYGVQVSSTTFLRLGNMILDGKNTVNYAVRGDRGYVFIENSQLYSKLYCMYATYGSRFDAWNNIGEGGTNAFRANDSSIISGNGTAPRGVSANSSEGYGGQVRGTWSSFTKDGGLYDTVTNPTPPAPAPVQTAVYFDSVRAASWRDSNGGWRTDNDYVYQGEWQGFGLHRGYWFFNDDAIRSTLAGKTVKSIRVYMARRPENGNNVAKAPSIGLHNFETTVIGGGTPAVPTSITSSHGVTIPSNTGKWVPLPLSFATAIQSGAARGLGLYDSSPTADEYMVFGSWAQIEIIYEG